MTMRKLSRVVSTITIFIFLLSILLPVMPQAKVSAAGNPVDILQESLEQKGDLFSNRVALVTYILDTQNPDGSFGPFANIYGTKSPLQALGAALSGIPAGSYIYTRMEEAISKAVTYFANAYADDMVYDANGWSFDARVVEALAAVGEDLSSADWTKDGESLADIVVASATTAAADADELSAVALAKEMSALHAVTPASAVVGTLAEAIGGKQDMEDGSFGTVYEHAAVLIALGRAGWLHVIDQAAALGYLADFRTEHQDDFGLDAGAAYGSWSPKEADLTAQVILALTFFDGAGEDGSAVHTAIIDGFAYLASIQEQDTAAVPDTYDSTFTTAEALLALLANTVQVAVAGKDGELLFGPAEIVFLPGNPWGETALGALHATGLSYSDDGGFVKSVDGQTNSGMMGWMYKVNDSVPWSVAYEYSAIPGSRVIWWYSTDPNSDGPTWAQLLDSKRASAAALGFADMVSHWAREDVHFMSDRQIVKGVSATEFAPERTVTRAEVASMLVRSLSLPAVDNSPVFTDVEPGAWYVDYVSAAAASGLIVGRAEGVFAPESPLTRAEIAVILSRVMADRTLPHSDPVDVLAAFDDSADIPDWAVAGMAEAVRLDLLKGRSATQLAPQETVTRAEAATLLARMLRMLEAGE